MAPNEPEKKPYTIGKQSVEFRSNGSSGSIEVQADDSRRAQYLALVISEKIDAETSARTGLHQPERNTMGIVGMDATSQREIEEILEHLANNIPDERTLDRSIERQERIDKLALRDVQDRKLTEQVRPIADAARKFYARRKGVLLTPDEALDFLEILKTTQLGGPGPRP